MNQMNLDILRDKLIDSQIALKRAQHAAKLPKDEELDSLLDRAMTYAHLANDRLNIIERDFHRKGVGHESAGASSSGQ